MTTEGDDDKNDYLFDPSSTTGKADPEIAQLEKSLGAARYRSVAPKERVARFRARPISPRQRVVRIVASLALAAAIVGLVYGAREWSQRSSYIANPTPSSTPPSAATALIVTRTQGTPRIDARPIASGQSGELGVGAWLETDESSRADIALAKIGVVHVEPSSRVRVVMTAPNEQRLELASGAISAKVIAPPRLFVVDTPAARATDLGCAYRLEVNGDGGGALHVSSGAVELANRAHSSWVPAGATCETRQGVERGPGCPWFDDALDPLKEAVRVFDTDPAHVPPGTVEAIISSSRRRDTLTLWHLRARVEDASLRAMITGRIEALTPGVKDGGASLDDLVVHW